MTIGVLKEPSDETRVSLLPEAAATLTKKGITVLIENGAGEKAFANDTSYENIGAQVKDRSEVIQSAQVLLSINHPTKSEIENLKSKILIGVYFPLYDPELMQQ